MKGTAHKKINSFAGNVSQTGFFRKTKMKLNWYCIQQQITENIYKAQLTKTPNTKPSHLVNLISEWKRENVKNRNTKNIIISPTPQFAVYFVRSFSPPTQLHKNRFLIRINLYLKNIKFSCSLFFFFFFSFDGKWGNEKHCELHMRTSWLS